MEVERVRSTILTILPELIGFRALAGSYQKADDWVIASEIGSFTLEFTRLSQLSGDMTYFDAAHRITDLLRKQQVSSKLPGMWPLTFNARNSRLDIGDDFGLGAFADSLYEYLPKTYMLLGGQKKDYRHMYEKAIDVAKTHLFWGALNPDNLDILVSAAVKVEDNNIKLKAQGQHLTCFVGGMLAIGAQIFERPDDLAIARKLVDGCTWAYQAMPSGMMPETFYFVPWKDNCQWDERKWHEAIRERATSESAKSIEAIIREHRLQPGFAEIDDRRYILRPEAIESVMVLYRITGDRTLQDRGWEMFQATIRHTRTEIAHAALEDVTKDVPPKMDRMESFWTAETLKYYYLLFSEPNVISLDDYVFNTEAHPLRRPK